MHDRNIKVFRIVVIITDIIIMKYCIKYKLNINKTVRLAIVTKPCIFFDALSVYA